MYLFANAHFIFINVFWCARDNMEEGYLEPYCLLSCIPETGAEWRCTVRQKILHPNPVIAVTNTLFT